MTTRVWALLGLPLAVLFTCALLVATGPAGPHQPPAMADLGPRPIAEGKTAVVSKPTGPRTRFSADFRLDRTAISDGVFDDEDLNSSKELGYVGLAGAAVIGPEIHQYIIPGDDRNLIDTFAASNACQPSSAPVGDHLASRISLTASSSRTIYYYDHWEDGYDADPTNPDLGSSTEIGMLGAGATVVFEDDINTADPNWGITLYYDGRDRITIVGNPASVIRAAYPSLTDSPIGTRLAGAWEVDAVENWGMRYIIPAGEDWGPGSDFELTAAGFTALLDDTQVYRNGSLVAVLNAGEVYGVPGGGDGPGGDGLNSGDIVTATAPVQAHLFASICTTTSSPNTGSRIWSGNGYTLRPRNEWTNDYWSPVPRRTGSDICRFGANVDTFLYNDTGEDITLTIDDGSVPPLIVSLPPGSSSVTELITPRLLSDSRGVHFIGDGPFWGVVNFDTRNVDHEWGYSLMPTDELSSLVVLGWAPGNEAIPPLAQYPPNGNLAFVTAVADTVVYVDLDQDGDPDRIDCNGDGDSNDVGVDGICDEPDSDLGIALVQGQTLRVADPVDALLRGALIYTIDLSQKIAVAWGQDSCVADAGLPYLDLGYTVLPFAISSVLKEATVVEDVDGSGDTTPGDIVEYSVVIVNKGSGPMNNVVLTDTLPYTYTDFIVDSVSSTLAPLPPGVEYYDGSTWDYIPISTGPFGADPNVQQLRLSWSAIEARQRVTTTFRVQIQYDVPEDLTEIRNVVLVCSDNTGCNEAKVITQVGQPILLLDKLPSDPTTVAPGDTLNYTVLAANVGSASAANAIISDVLPPWLTFIPHTLDLTWPVAQVITTVTPITSVTGIFTPTYGDNFDLVHHITGTTGYTGTDGTVPWLNDWTEFNDDGSYESGNIRVLVNASGAKSPYAYLQLTNERTGDFEPGVRRCVNLFSFEEPHLTYQMRGIGTNSGVYKVVITGTTAITTFTFSELFTDYRYETRDLNISQFGGHSAVCVSFMAGVSMGGGDLPVDQYRIDDVFIYDAVRERYETFYLIEENTVITYSSATNINPVDYTRILPGPTTPAITHTIQFTNAFPFPPQTDFTATFQMMVGYPLTDGLQMVNTACVTATNLMTDPYPLCDTVTTTVQSSHALSVSKQDDPNAVRTGDTLTYSIKWEVAGDEPAPGVVVTDVLPSDNVSFISCLGGLSCSENDDVIVWDLGDRLPPLSQVAYDSGWLTLTVHVDQEPVSPTCLFTNTVYIDDATDTPGDQDDEPTEGGECRTAIELLYFRASPKASGVLVEWATLFEIDTYGFWLYRSANADLDHAVPVTFVPSRGWQAVGAVYGYLDAYLPPGYYHYWLVEVENGGKRTTYGPISSWSGWDDADLPYRIYLPLVQR